MRNKKADSQKAQIPATLKGIYDYSVSLYTSALGSSDVNEISTANIYILRLNDSLDSIGGLDMLKRCYLDENGQEVCEKSKAFFE